jgi:hypothetical protein
MAFDLDRTLDTFVGEMSRNIRSVADLRYDKYRSDEEYNRRKRDTLEAEERAEKRQINAEARAKDDEIDRERRRLANERVIAEKRMELDTVADRKKKAELARQEIRRVVSAFKLEIEVPKNLNSMPDDDVINFYKDKVVPLLRPIAEERVKEVNDAVMKTIKRELDAANVSYSQDKPASNEDSRASNPNAVATVIGKIPSSSKNYKLIVESLTAGATIGDVRKKLSTGNKEAAAEFDAAVNSANKDIATANNNEAALQFNLLRSADKQSMIDRVIKAKGEYVKGIKETFGPSSTLVDLSVLDRPDWIPVGETSPGSNLTGDSIGGQQQGPRRQVEIPKSDKASVLAPEVKPATSVKVFGNNPFFDLDASPVIDAVSKRLNPLHRIAGREGIIREGVEPREPYVIPKPPSKYQMDKRVSGRVLNPDEITALFGGDPSSFPEDEQRFARDSLLREGYSMGDLIEYHNDIRNAAAPESMLVKVANYLKAARHKKSGGVLVGDQYERAPMQGPSVIDQFSPLPVQSDQSFYRADGGPVQAGRPYIVGERGPEVIVPETNGVVIPNELTGIPKKKSDDQDYTEKFNYPLSPEDESAFQEWLKKNSHLKKMMSNIDLRNFWVQEIGPPFRGGQISEYSGDIGPTYFKPNHPKYDRKHSYPGPGQGQSYPRFLVPTESEIEYSKKRAAASGGKHDSELVYIEGVPYPYAQGLPHRIKRGESDTNGFWYIQDTR